MQWGSLHDARSAIENEYALRAGDVFFRGPESGSLPFSVAQTLWPLLEPHTQTRERCFFGIWEGFGCLARRTLEAPAFEMPARTFRLFTGPLGTIEQTFCTNDSREAVSSGIMVATDLTELQEAAQARGVDVLIASGTEHPPPEAISEVLRYLPLPDFPPTYQSANLWWPDDRAWCVATEIDFNTTYIAGSRTLLDALLGSGALEVYEASPTDGVTYGSDHLNPLPLDPYGNSFRLG